MALRKELSDFERGVIYGCHISGKSQNQIVELTGHPKSTIDSFLRKYKQTQSHKNKQRSGRPKLIDERGERQLHRLVKGNRRLSLLNLTAKYNAGEAQASTSTIRRSLHSLGYYGRSCAKKPLITSLNRKRRLKWCMERRNWTQEQWRSVIWSDESRFTLFKSDGRNSVWRRIGERFQYDCVIPTVKYDGGSIMFWSYFTAQGTGPLVKCSNHMNSEEYRAILDNELVPFLPEISTLIFQQDHSSIHTSNLMKQFFKMHDVNVMEWIPQSPDLNPIEFLWNEVNRRIRKRHRLPTSLAELESMLQEEWANIPVQLLEDLVDSMPKRVREVIHVHGFATKY